MGHVSLNAGGSFVARLVIWGANEQGLGEEAALIVVSLHISTSVEIMIYSYNIVLQPLFLPSRSYVYNSINYVLVQLQYSKEQRAE
jgi:hypothetical protein